MLFYISIVVALVILAYVLYGVWSDHWNGLGEKIFFSVMGTFIAGIAIFAFGMLSIAIYDGFTEDEWRHSYDIELQAINMGNDVRGAFFLGSGVVDGENVYSYYYKTEGGYRADQIDADEVLIIESDETPHIEVREQVIPDWVFPNVTDWEYSYTIYVPNNSIRPMINMDLPE